MSESRATSPLWPAISVRRATWTPASEVEKTETFDPPGAELDMQVLGTLADGSAGRGGVVAARVWLSVVARRPAHGSRRLGGRAKRRGRAASLFITSAHLTAAAWDRNIELGLLVRDRARAATTVIHFRTLIENDLLRQVPGS